MSGRNSWKQDINESEMGPSAGRDISWLVHFMLFLILGFFIAFFLWARWANLDEVTRGEGKVVPSGQVKLVQHLEGGIISDILVEEGQIVDEGEVLYRIENKSAEAELAEKRKRRLSFLATASRLQAEVGAEQQISFADEVRNDGPELVLNEQRLFTLRRRQLDEQINILLSQHTQKKQELRELTAKVGQLRKTRDIAQKELDLLKPLVAQGVAPKLDLYRAEQRVQELSAEIEGVQLALPRTKTAVNEASNKIAEKRSGFRTEAQQELNQVQSDVTRLDEEITAGVDRAVRTEVRSPVRGQIQQMLMNTIGGVVRPGDPLVEVVPLEDRLVVEARIRPSDRAQLWPGLPATVKVSAYDFSIHGGLTATLTDISPDTITDEQGETFYRIRLQTEETSLGEDKPIKPGMTATVDILTGKKTVLDYLMKPILKARQNALTER